MSDPNRHILHLSLAEHGKLCLLRGDGGEALRHFREALRLCVSAKAPEVFFRHYTQCVLEALEKAGSFAEIAGYCREADAFYAARDLDDAFHRKDHGAILERLGIALIRLDDREAAVAALTRAIDRAGPGVLPLAEELLGWLRRGYAVSGERIAQLQQRHRYFVIREGSVDAALARALPPDSARTAPSFALA